MPVEHSQGRLRPQVPRVDELPAGVPAEGGAVAPPQAAIARRSNGTVADRSSAAELGRRGAAKRWSNERQLRALRSLGLRGEPPAALAPYLEDASAFAEVKIAELAQQVGGGVCGPGPSSIVQSAALELAGSRAAYDRGDAVTGSKLAGSSRANLLSAHELCALEAAARPRPGPAELLKQRAAALALVPKK